MCSGEQGKSLDDGSVYGSVGVKTGFSLRMIRVTSRGSGVQLPEIYNNTHAVSLKFSIAKNNYRLIRIA